MVETVIIPCFGGSISACKWKCIAERIWQHQSVHLFLAVITLLLLAGCAVAQVSCDQANDLVKGKLYDQAQAAYVILLNNDTSRDCAREGFLELQRVKARNLYELGQAYEKANQEDAAKLAYIEALKNDPNSSEAGEALARVNGGVWGRVLTSAYSILTSISKILALILMIPLLYYAVKLRILPRWKELKKPRLDIQDFDTGATNLNIGKGMVAMVEEKLKWFEKEKYHAQKFELVNPIGMLEIPADLKSISPEVKYISQLVDWLFPPNVIKLSGCMEKPGERGSGLTLTLVNSQSGEIIGSQTLWQEEYGPVKLKDIKENDPEPYYSLVEPAAIWVFFQLHTFYEKEVGAKASFKIFNTGNWQSYAYFRAGVNLKEKIEKRKMYLKALDSDPDNVGALLNLGYSNMEANEFRCAIERLERVKDIIKSDMKEYFVWFMASYQLCATYYNMREKQKAMDEAKKLIDKIRLVYRLQKDEPLMKFLDSFKPKAEILFALILADKGMLVEAEEVIEDIKKDLMKLTSISRYNLACYYSIVGEKLGEEASQNNAYEDALNHLNYALESGTLIMQAKNDISLEGLRKNTRTKEKFAKLIKKYSLLPTKESPENLPLAGLTTIQEIYARQLQEHGIVSSCDLIKLTNTHSSREALAMKLGISDKLLYRWAQLADLMNIVKDTKQVNLLEAAGIGSLEALKKVSDPCELANLLNQVNKAQSLVKQLPSIEAVKGWVQEAKKTKPMVM